jgi:hypothetical protein
MSEHYTPETFAPRLAKILAHPFYGAPWPLPPQRPGDQAKAIELMTEWCLVNLALYNSGSKTGIARIYDYDGIATIAAWDNLTAIYRHYDDHGCEHLRPIYGWLHSNDRITVAGAKYWPDNDAPLVLVGRRLFINNENATSVEERIQARFQRYSATKHIEERQ